MPAKLLPVPWRAVLPSPVPEIPTMISREERQFLYWVGRHLWSGEGSIHEVGPWLGGSTVCIAAGMRDSGFQCQGRLHTYDNFRWRSFMVERSGLALNPGDSFLPRFREYTKEFESIVVPHPCALSDETIADDRVASAKRAREGEHDQEFSPEVLDFIEILFVDGAKSWRAARELFLKTEQWLEPGKSHLIFQDFKYWSAYWIPLIAEYLAPSIRLEYLVFGEGTAAFAVEHAIDQKLLRALPDHVTGLEPKEVLRTLSHAATRLLTAGDAVGASCVNLSAVSFLAHHEMPGEACIAWKDAVSRWPMWTAIQPLQEARHYLIHDRGLEFRPPLRWGALNAGELGRKLARRLVRSLK